MSGGSGAVVSMLLLGAVVILLASGSVTRWVGNNVRPFRAAASASSQQSGTAR